MYMIDKSDSKNPLLVAKKWISVKDKLPPPDKTVIVYSQGLGHMWLGFYTGDISKILNCHKFYLIDDMGIDYSVTHWMDFIESPIDEVDANFITVDIINCPKAGELDEEDK